MGAGRAVRPIEGFRCQVSGTNSPSYFDWEEELEILQKDLAGFQPEHMIVPKDAPFLTGSVLRLDGGYVLGGETVADMPQGVI